ncbi:hypothetical protein [Paenibacillus sp. NPDC057934]
MESALQTFSLEQFAKIMLLAAEGAEGSGEASLLKHISLSR